MSSRVTEYHGSDGKETNSITDKDSEDVSDPLPSRLTAMDVFLKSQHVASTRRTTTTQKHQQNEWKK